MLEVIIWFASLGAFALLFGMPRGAVLAWRWPMTWRVRIAAAGSAVLLAWLYARLGIGGFGAGFLAGLAGLVPFVRISVPGRVEVADQRSPPPSLPRLPPPAGGSEAR